MKGSSHPNLKIVKLCNFMRAPRLRASPRQGGTWSFQVYFLTETAAGAPRRGRRCSSQIIMRNKHSITHICLIQFHRKS